VVLLRQMIDQSEAGEERKRLEHRKLDALVGYCETTRCRRQVLLACFGEEYAAKGPGEPCGNCDNCLSPPETWDATVAAQKALSCVYRTGQRFGAAHVIDVLRGSESERIRQFGHDALSTYGIGTELDARAWRGVFRQLVAAGLLAVDSEGYGGLRLTADSRDVLVGKRKVLLRRDAPRPRGRGRGRGGEGRAPRAVEVARADQPLFEALRAM